MASINDFEFLNNSTHRQIYSTIREALKYYLIDPKITCIKFRDSLECILDHIYATIKIEKDDLDLCNRIDLLRKLIEQGKLPKELMSNEIIAEMHTLRRVSNSHHHYNEEEPDPTKDRLTCYMALLKICQWYEEFSKQYPLYLEHKEKEERENKEKRKKTWKTIGKIALIPIGIAGAIFSIKIFTKD